MILDTVQSASLLVLALLAIGILLRILAIVHKQTRRVKELEMRMRAFEEMDVDPETIATTEKKED